MKTARQLELEETVRLDDPANFRPGIYQHFKGPKYRALFLAEDSTNRSVCGVAVEREEGILESSQAPMVVYISNENSVVHVRELSQWNEMVPNPGHDVRKLGQAMVRRFEYIGDGR